MADIVVVGAGVAGLGSALALGRRGHRVTLLERDATPPPADAHDAFSWDRHGAPQVRHSHALLARLRNLLRDTYPDVLADLLAAGATEIRFSDLRAPEMEGWEPEPADDDLVALACRRTTFEWILRRAALACDHVTFEDGAVVTTANGTTDPISGLPVVTGVAGTRHGRDAEWTADVVVDAGGRRADVGALLGPLGVEIPGHTEDTGIVYLSRFYRLHDHAQPPAQQGPVGGDLGYLKYAVFQGDNRTFSVTFAALAGDRELRRHLVEPDTFDRVATELPATAPWVDKGVAEPTTEVAVMARLVNQLRSFVDGDRPRVLGFHAVGDAHTCTNPLYGRGCSLAMVQSVLLADAVDAHPQDLVGRSLEYEADVARDVEPWYHAAVLQDGQAKRWVDRQKRKARGEDAADLEDDPGVQMVDLIREGFLPATRTDPHVFRAFLRMFNLLDQPSAMMADPAVMSRVLASYADRANRPAEPALGPRRRELLAAIEVAA